MHYPSMDVLIKSLSPDVRQASLAALGEPQRTDTALHMAQNGHLRERDLQAACFERFAQLAIARPEFGMIFAIPNGQYRAGQRMEPGLKSGVPDIMVCVPRRFTDKYGDSYYLGGLFIELKVGHNQVSTPQLEWMHRLTMQGYRCVVCRDSVDSVIAVIEEYLTHRGEL